MAGFLVLASAWASALWAEPVSSLEDLRQLEGKVKLITEKALPATVSLFSEEVGSSGSGVVVSREGLVLTAAHVVEGLDEITVVFPDGKQEKAEVLGSNRSKDAALARLRGKGPWPFVEMGDSRGLAVGQFVVSLGHTGGFDPLRTPPVRFGRVVGLNVVGFVGTDCTLIGGDSGGPLFDLDGKVVGIHSSIGGSLDANYHTGVSGFKTDWDRLMKGETWGELEMNPLRNQDRPVMGFNVGGPADGGVMISEVFPNSPAAVAGLRTGDVVRAVDGQRVGNLRALYGILGRHTAGDEVEVAFRRGGEEMTRRLKLARLADVIGEDE